MALRRRHRALGAALGAAASLWTCFFPGAASAADLELRTLESSPAQSGPRPRGTGLDQEQALRISQGAIGRIVGDYTLRDAEGRPLRLSSLRGKPLLVSFIYTGCFQVCPTATHSLKGAVDSAIRTFGTDRFNVVSIGFNQPFDTPEMLKAFARQQGVYVPNWRFLSPHAATLDALAADLGFTYIASAGGFDHITQVTVLDRNGRVYRQLYGDQYLLPQVVGALKELIAGAPPAGDGVTGLIERVRILCTYYDPVSGRYRFRSTVLLEVASGLLGILLTLAWLVKEARRTRRRTTA